MKRFMTIAGMLFLGLMMPATGRTDGQASLLGHAAPEISGGPWLNSPPLTLNALRGRVVLLDFWTSG